MNARDDAAQPTEAHSFPVSVTITVDDAGATNVRVGWNPDNQIVPPGTAVVVFLEDLHVSSNHADPTVRRVGVARAELYEMDRPSGPPGEFVRPTRPRRT